MYSKILSVSCLYWRTNRLHKIATDLYISLSVYTVELQLFLGACLQCITGQIKNIKLLIVTDIKVTYSLKWIMKINQKLSRTRKWVEIHWLRFGNDLRTPYWDNQTIVKSSICFIKFLDYLEYNLYDKMSWKKTFYTRKRLSSQRGWSWVPDGIKKDPYDFLHTVCHDTIGFSVTTLARSTTTLPS